MSYAEIREENIQRAIDIGMEVLIQEGVDGFQKYKISEKLGLSIRSLTRYFQTKEYFIYEILMKMYKNDIENVEKMWDRDHMDEKTGIEQLNMLFDFIKNIYYKQGEKILAIIDAQMLLRNFDDKEKMSNQLMGSFDVFKNVIERCIKNGRQDGSIKISHMETDIIAEIITTTLWGMFSRLAYMERIQIQETNRIQDALQTYIDHVLNELRNEFRADDYVFRFGGGVEG